MPVPETHVPKICQQKGRNRAFVRLDGKTIYLGRWGSAQSRQAYDQIIREWLDNGRSLPERVTVSPASPDGGTSDTIDMLCADYLQFARGYYRKYDHQTEEVVCLESVIRVWLNLFPVTPVSAFGPKQLKQVREEMIRRGHTRKTINSNISRIKRIVAWGVEEGKVKGETLYCLQAVKGLRKGRSGAKESKPVKPVPQALVEATLLHCNPQVRAMVELQLATGMRPGEVVIMRACDIAEMDQAIWKYTPAYHKTEAHDIKRQIPLGPRAQAIIKKFLKAELQAYLFSAADAVDDQRADRRKARQTPRYPSHMHRQWKEEPQWQPSDHYTEASYRRAITRACDKAHPLPAELRPDTMRATWPRRKELQQKLGDEKFNEHHAKVLAWYETYRWAPNRLRHSFGTMIRRQYGLDAAQVLLGHQNIDVTEIYAEKDYAKAAEVAGAVG